MKYVIGIDGGGTRTTLGLADEHGCELLRREGPAGRVDARQPSATVEMLEALVLDAIADAGLTAPATALCAGLAGVGDPRQRARVEAELARTGIAERVRVLSDGEIALRGALGGKPGILLVSGTGSVAHGRAEDGRVERCGGWGMVVGDEGSGYAIGRDGIRAALQSSDGRGRSTLLLPAFLRALDLADRDEIPSWVGQASKASIASLAVHVLQLAEDGDAVAHEILVRAAGAMAHHAAALHSRLGPWTVPASVVLHGGMARQPRYAGYVRQALEAELPCVLRNADADAVSGALLNALELLGRPLPA